MLFEILSILLGFVLLVYFYFQHNYQYFKRVNIYSIEPSFPYGNFGKIITGKQTISNEIKNFYLKAREQNVPAVGVYEFHHHFSVIRS